jgi:hypothetical protein
LTRPAHNRRVDQPPARPQLIKGVGKLIAARSRLSFKLPAVGHSLASSVVWLQPHRAAAVEWFCSGLGFYAQPRYADGDQNQSQD